MPNEPQWLPIEAVIEHNRLEVAATGEHHFVRDLGLLESALARPRNAFAYGEEDVLVLAVALMAGVARAHAFEQGNKRTAFEAMWHFLRLNGYDLAIDDSQSWADPVVALIEHRSTEEEFARALRPFIVPRPA
ncbi:MAG TPA: type II toxin-antitoxin system death-on-curing family toxin [Stellaceae bacterium]|nr:type II toxin-antitoxin system death-on-curing family toxin [Stellaceae bacterium]